MSPNETRSAARKKNNYAPPQNNNSHTPHILLADSDPDECKLFKDAIETLNIPCTLSVIQNEEVFLKSVKQQDIKYDFIFWDIQEPCASDNHCLELIKKKSKLHSIPVIIFSKSANPLNRDYCYKARAYEYFLRALSFLL